MTPLIVLAVIVAALVLPLIISLVRTPTMGAMAVRNVRRRRGEAILVIAGSLLGTAIITSSFVVGDIVDGSIRDAARTQLGPIDIVASVPDPAELAATRTAIDEAGIDAVDGTLLARRATVALEAPANGERDTTVLPSAEVVELDVGLARQLGGDPAATGLDTSGALAPTEMLVHERTAARLDLTVGDTVRVHAYGATRELTVADITPEVGLAGYGAAIVAPGTLTGFVGSAPTEAAPPRSLVLVSLEGGVFDSADASAAVLPELRRAVSASGVEIETAKADLLEAAELEGAMLAELFTTIGSFSVLAGILLLVNLFVMLAEERKTELGMLRALGFTRRRLSRTFALEGTMYAAAAAVVGTGVGVLIGWIVARVAGAIFGIADQGFDFRLVVEPTSLALGGSIGLAISLVTIWITSVRISRLNVIRAIRDLPEPQHATVRARTLLLGGTFVLLGAAAAAFGYLEEQAILLLLGVPVAAFAATPLLRRVVPERAARLTTAAITLGWGIGAFTMFPDILGQADLPIFVVQGVVLTAGAVSAVASLDPLWRLLVDTLSVRGRGLAARLGVAYPLARRFRTSMLLSMFSLVIFTMTFIAAMSAQFDDQARSFAAEARGGYDVVIDSNPANPVDARQLLDDDEVVAAAGIARSFARFEADFTHEPRTWAISGIDEDLLAEGAPPLSTRGEGYATDDAVYRAVIADPGLAIVPDTFLQGGPSPDRIRVGDRFEVLHPVTGEAHTLTAAAISSVDWLWNGAMVSRELTGELFASQDVATRHYLAVADGADADAVATRLNVEYLTNGADAASFAGLVSEGVRQQNAFLYLLQAFLGLGLLVGIAGLGVVMIRAVRERRQEIGMLRAMGFPTGLVRSAFLSEASVVAVQGTAIGAVLGLVTARQVFASTDVFGDTMGSFVIPWVGLAVVILAPLLASLAATAWPAMRAAATRPAVALRTAE